jgi:hypothetical protein
MGSMIDNHLAGCYNISRPGGAEVVHRKTRKPIVPAAFCALRRGDRK